LNWTPLGRDMVVTKCEGNILYELDGMPIFDIYKKYLGDDVMENFPESSMEFPLIVKKDHIYVGRDPLVKTGDDAVMYAGNFELGDIVRFSFGNIEDITDETQEYFEKFKNLPAEAVFIYSCAARKSLMGEKLEDEISILESLAPSTGFFTYGEYFHASNIVEVLNVTTTFLTLSESKKVPQRVLKLSPVKEYDPVKKVLTHLIKVAVEELEHVSTHDALTSLYNRAEYIKRVALKIKSAQRYSEEFGLILIDVDHFKLVNDNYGHVVGDKVLQKIAQVLMSNVREDDLVARWGGEEFVIIANHATDEVLESLVKKLQQKIAEVSFAPVPKVTLSFGLSAYMDGDTETSLFKRVDNSLYTAKDSGRNCYILG
ncbi:MAG: diguanylate cyclase, partial [Campylobacterota bacterium]|nr:diguanylate cyclase [Campylobacterota bacterium]